MELRQGLQIMKIWGRCNEVSDGLTTVIEIARVKKAQITDAIFLTEGFTYPLSS